MTKIEFRKEVGVNTDEKVLIQRGDGVRYIMYPYKEVGLSEEEITLFQEWLGENHEFLFFRKTSSDSNCFEAVVRGLGKRLYVYRGDGKNWKLIDVEITLVCQSDQVTESCDLCPPYNGESCRYWDIDLDYRPCPRYRKRFPNELPIPK